MMTAYVQFYQDDIKARLTYGVGKHLTFQSVARMVNFCNRNKLRMVLAGNPINLAEEKQARKDTEERFRALAQEGGVA